MTYYQRRALTKEWFSAAELAELKLPAIPKSKGKILDLANRENWHECQGRVRPRAGRGGGFEYHYSILPIYAVREVVSRFRPEAEAANDTETSSEAAWSFFAGRPEKHRELATARAAALDELQAMIDGGWPVHDAAYTVANSREISRSTLFQWRALVEGYERGDWLPALAPAWKGGGKQAECPVEAWDYLVADYLRPEQPSFAACYRRLQGIAEAREWTLPSKKTLQRRVEREISEDVKILARKGSSALKDLLPAQRRSVADVPVLGCVVGDGHLHDLWVQFPNGAKPARPMTLFLSDLRTRKILAWRTDETEHSGSVRLAIGDVVEKYGIPDSVLFDNGRGFASKWITGQAPRRFRFKIKHEEPQGLLTALGVQIHWALPFSGRSKPIERSFKDMCEEVAKHPAFTGAYTGNAPQNKPHNYGEKAIPLDEFEAVLAAEVARWNARQGRRMEIANGRSIDDAFNEGYAETPIRRATAAQRALWLLAADDVAVRNKPKGEIQLYGNRYHANALMKYAGRKVTVRFDPLDLQRPLIVYDRTSGQLIAEADCIADAGFFDTDAARAWARAQRQAQRAARDGLTAEKRMSTIEAAQMLPGATPGDALPETRVVRPVFGKSSGNAALAIDTDADVVAFDWDAHERGLALVQKAKEEDGDA